MSKFLTRQYLLLVAALLLALKLLVFPLLSWQSAKLIELNAKYRQLNKMSELVSRTQFYAEEIASVLGEIEGSKRYFYENSEGLKLSAQKDIEQIFSSSGLELKAFFWLIDSGDVIRKLRARLVFSGSTSAMIQTFLALDNHQKLMKKVEWKQNINLHDGVNLGVTSGHLILELYAADSPIDSEGRKPDGPGSNFGKASVASASE